MPLDYIMNLPEGVLSEFMSLNIISPFTTDAQAYREGLIATLLYNNNVSKKSDAKSITDLFPYLNTETPEWLEDSRVNKAKQLLESIQCHMISPETYNKNYNMIKGKIIEEIEIERSTNKPDQYVITKLLALINEEN